MKKNLIVGQSGGPTAVINGSLYGVVTEAMRHTEEINEIYGMINGIEGFLNGHMMDMRSLIETNELSLLRTTPGSYLGSCRYKLPEDLNDPVYPCYSTSLHRMVSVISSILGEMIPWIL